MTIKTVYVAYDGEIFDTREECVKYETDEMPITHCGFMACADGETEKIEEADFVYFNEPIEMENFILVCDRLSLVTEGLPEQSSVGYYLWNYDSLTWCPVPDYLGNVLYNSYKNK